MRDSIDVILFDLGGVLVELGPSPLPAGAIADDRAFALADWFKSEAAIAFEKGSNSAAAFARALIDELDLDCSQQALIEHFTEWPVGLFPGAHELLQRLRGDYRLAILTNTNELHYPRFAGEFRLMEHTEYIFASHQLALAKPEPAIYQHVINTLETDPARILFLDDNRDNVAAAQELGIEAHHIEGFDKLEQFLGAQGIIGKNTLA